MIIETWQTLLAEAKAARARGQVLRALSLYQATTERHPENGAPYFEMAEFIAARVRDLGDVQRLFDQHRRNFHLSGEISISLPLAGPANGEDAPHRALRAFEQACTIEPGNNGWQLAWADACEAAGDLEQALQIRRRVAAAQPHKFDNELRIARLLEALGPSGESRDKAIEVRRRIADAHPRKYENELAIARLLEGLGRRVEATEAYETVIARTLSAPEAMLGLARLREEAQQRDKAKIIAEDLIRLMRADWSAPRERAEFLYRLARAAAIDGLPASAQGIREELVKCAMSFADSEPTSVRAELAVGFAALIAGDATTARRSFAIASWLAVQNKSASVETSDADEEMTTALSFARAYLLAVAEKPSYVDLAPAIRPDDLVLAHARWLRECGQVREALAEYGRWMDPTLVTRLRDVYKGHRIYRQGSVFYGVPLTVPVFVILLGTVYCVPDNVLRNFQKLPRVIQVALRRLRRALGGEIRFAPGQSSTSKPSFGESLRDRWRRVGRDSIRLGLQLALRRLKVENAFSAPDRWALIAKIDA